MEIVNAAVFKGQEYSPKHQEYSQIKSKSSFISEEVALPDISANMGKGVKDNAGPIVTDSINPFANLPSAPPTELDMGKSGAGWRRVSTRQWVRDMRAHIAGIQELPYKKVCGLCFSSFGYYPDMVPQDSYEQYVSTHPLHFQRHSITTGVYTAGLDLDFVPPTTYMPKANEPIMSYDNNMNLPPPPLEESKPEKKKDEADIVPTTETEVEEGKGKKKKKKSNIPNEVGGADAEPEAEGKSKKSKKKKKKEDGEDAAAEGDDGAEKKSKKKKKKGEEDAAAPEGEEATEKKSKKKKKKGEEDTAAEGDDGAEKKSKKKKKKGEEDAAAAEGDDGAEKKSKKKKKKGEEDAAAEGDDGAEKKSKKKKKKGEEEDAAAEGDEVEEGKGKKGKGKKGKEKPPAAISGNLSFDPVVYDLTTLTVMNIPASADEKKLKKLFPGGKVKMEDGGASIKFSDAAKAEPFFTKEVTIDGQNLVISPKLKA